jgi:arginase
VPLTVALIGVPSALGAPDPGPEQGPEAIRAHHLIEKLEALGVAVQDFGDVNTKVQGAGGIPGLRGVEVLAARARNSVHLALDAEIFPILLGGEHCVALGTIAGAAKAHPDLGILWIDAHPDFHTLESSVSGNPHGMVLAMAAGLGPPDALKRLGRIPLVPPHRIAIVGARSIDPAEGEFLEREGIRFGTSDDELRHGAEEAADRAAGHLNRSGADAVHISVDLDVLDPISFPGVSTPVGRGIPLADLLGVVKRAIERLNVVSLDVVELDPPRDKDGKTTEAAVQVIETAALALLQKA